MKKKVQLFMVDDHPFILQAYKNSLDRYKPLEYEINYTEAICGKTGYEAIINNSFDFDIAFLDISIPVYTEKNIHSGIDLALLLRTEMPDCKIVLLTMHDEKLHFDYIFEHIKPNGIIIKNDLDFEELLNAFEIVLSENTYHSETVIKMINQ